MGDLEARQAGDGGHGRSWPPVHAGRAEAADSAAEPLVADARRFRPAARRPVRASMQASPLSARRMLGVATGAAAVIAGTAAYFWLIVDDLTSAQQPPGPVLGWIIVAVGAIAGGLALCWWSARAIAKGICAGLAVVLIAAASLMLAFAPVYRQIDAPGIAEYRASDAMYLFGAMTLLCGLALAALSVRWALAPEARARLGRWRRPLGAAYGVLLSLAGLQVLVLLVFGVALDPDEVDRVVYGITIAALGAQLLIPGLLLTFHGITASLGRRSRPYRAPIALVAAAAFGVVAAVGGVNMASEEPSWLGMPPLHVLAGALPGIAYVGLASRGSWWGGRAVRGLTWRQVLLAWGLAIAVGAFSAGIVNSFGGLAVTVVLLARSGAFEGLGSVEAAWDVIDGAAIVLSPREQWLANIIAIAVIPPLGEEFLKGLSARFMMKARTLRGEAFVLGAAAGAGFGFVEALLYGAGAAGDDASQWWAIMLLRAGTTALHCLNTGIVAVGWWELSRGRRARAAVLFFSAVLLHAAWNGFSVTLFSQIFWLDTVEDRTLERVAYAFVAVLAAAFVLTLPRVARALREGPPPPVGGTALGAMRPWLG